MKLKKSMFTIVFFLLAASFIPTVIFAEDVVSEVLLVIQPDEILAFSSLKNNWVSESLGHNEKVLKKGANGNVAVVVTNKRLLGFSALTNEWRKENLGFNELIDEIQVDGNAASVVTVRRIFGFNAHTGDWLEAK
ncbi:MAG: hypothetical protein KKG47_05005 [Proteobacteria bacterium]|nr:hypothetical protein [Pseudomonadota bacterium]MBU1739706.1 hypothetical protein [Pseudomonadota bacterium]